MLPESKPKVCWRTSAVAFEPEIDPTYMGSIERGRRKPKFTGDGQDCGRVVCLLPKLLWAVWPQCGLVHKLTLGERLESYFLVAIVNRRR